MTYAHAQQSQGHFLYVFGNVSRCYDCYSTHDPRPFTHDSFRNGIGRCPYMQNHDGYSIDKTTVEPARTASNKHANTGTAHETD